MTVVRGHTVEVEGKNGIMEPLTRMGFCGKQGIL